MQISRLTLPNGIRLVHQHDPGKVSHCGVLINAGSRDETDKEHGIAHFIEHVVFKGTRKRNLYQVLNRLEDIGADLNAYTTKEDTCIYASFLTQYYARTLELMSDVLFNSTFPQKELEKEKDVVIDEIKSYEDNPSEQIMDDFEDLVFAGHPLGRNILGTPRNIKRLKGDDLRKFIDRNYNTDQIVISSVGNISFHTLSGMVMKYFGHIPIRTGQIPRTVFKDYQPSQVLRKRKIYQTHCVIGAPAYSAKDEKRFPMSFLNNLLGGPTLNSRLSLALRERNGITYNIESSYVPYTDTGIVSVYFGTSTEMLQKALEITDKELWKVRTKMMTSSAFDRAKKQLIGQMAVSQESKAGQMLANGKSILVNDEVLSFDELVQIVHQMTPAGIMETAAEIFEPSRLSRLIFQS